jgi:chromosome segregation protein
LKILRLELFGFKSFKDKTIVTFDQNITAIVGSNGCGKSNVVDALYWVMGDMSPKHLRGSSMTDVIFSGSKDAAAMDVAEVTLVMSRDPEKDPELPPQFQASNEIQITRRYYRNGESEYIINKTQCRLRDIQEFFMDTGVGAKAYSIVEQGAISRMISLKPEDRRVVIEEVAGIMKFKARKAETERKIENSKLNLQRIDDIVQDLQKQLTTLKRQADKAEKFKVFSEQLRQLELSLASREWLNRSDDKSKILLKSVDLRNQLSSTEESLALEKSRLTESENQLASVEAELNEKRETAKSFELQLKDVESTLRNLQTRVENFEHRLSSNKENLQSIEGREIELAKELENCQQAILSQENNLSVLSEKLQESETEQTILQDKLKELSATLQEHRKNVHLEEIAQTKITQQVQNLQRQVSSIESRRLQIEEQIIQLSDEIDLKSRERANTLTNLEEAFTTRKELEALKLEVDSELAAFEKERNERLTARDTVKQELTVIRIRKEQLEALERDLEGVESAAKAMAFELRNRGQEKVLLADQIQVPPTFEKAVDAVLGRNLSRVVTQSFSEVENLRGLLAQSEDSDSLKSRAPIWVPRSAFGKQALSGHYDLDSIFVPLAQDNGSAFENSSLLLTDPVGLQEIPGPDGLVAHSEMATETQPQTQTLKNYLLSNSQVIGPLVTALEHGGVLANWVNLVKDFWIVRDRETLLKIATEIENLPIGLVSLDGDVLHPNGFLDLAPIQANQDDTTSNLIHRKRVINELRESETSFNNLFLEAESALDLCVQNIHQSKDKFRELTQRLAALNPDVERYSTFLREVEAKIARLSEKKILLEEEVQKGLIESAEINQKLEELSVSLQEIEVRKNAIQSLVIENDNVREIVQNQVAEKNSILSDLRSQIKTAERELSSVQNTRSALTQEQSLQNARKSQIFDENTRFEEQAKACQEEIDISQLKYQEQQQLFEEATRVATDIQELVQSTKAGLRGIQAGVEKIQADYAQLSVEIKDLEQGVAIHEVELKNLSEKIESSYQIMLSQLEESRLREMASPLDIEEIADHEAGKKLATQLRNKIDNLGKINMVAIEEFEDVRNRHEYLFIQREDLADSLRQLRDAIDRIDRESRERFADAFTAVNAAFTKTFPLLFGGGNAELRLTVPDNMLETGVEIVAQPPGKKLQSVTLLSGGEKALTAVSLIFGIFSIKPSPFCVLDEVDAPLDDANVGRFNNLVRQITDRSQVIMITHHKKTMESADAMFGVTMEKPGISKLASVRLTEYK